MKIKAEVSVNVRGVYCARNCVYLNVSYCSLFRKRLRLNYGAMRCKRCVDAELARYKNPLTMIVVWFLSRKVKDVEGKKQEGVLDI